jgi:hypothetical protein
MEIDDLFHLDRAMTPEERRRLQTKLRSKKTGHVAPPGTGPDGETCKTCEHLVRKQMAKTYLKCGLNRAKWTGGGGTDVRAGDPACRQWAALTNGELSGGVK